ncbi:MAG: hypothetical protein PHP00_02750 [Thiotrichaceae bacterium]|nr:hypothetical protein [Thiotrichaceae bacterium]
MKSRCATGNGIAFEEILGFFFNPENSDNPDSDKKVLCWLF